MSKCDVPWNDPAYGGKNTFMVVHVDRRQVSRQMTGTDT